jgi:hypothetical protein
VGSISVSPNWVRAASESLGDAWEGFSRTDMARDREDPWAHREGTPAPTRLYLEADGTSIHLCDGWHEVKVGGVFQTERTGKRQERGATQFVAGLENADQFFWRLHSLACAQGAHLCPELIAIGDGAEWIRNGMSAHFPEAVQIVDWYHAKEHLWTVARLCYGDADQRKAEWAVRAEAMLWEGDVEGVLRSMARLRPRSAEAREAVRTNRGYFSTNKDRMRYGEFRRKDYYIGSGVVEAACKQVVTLRCKRSSMRWSRRGAQAILRLRCSLLSGKFQQDWSRHRQVS